MEAKFETDKRKLVTLRQGESLCLDSKAVRGAAIMDNAKECGGASGPLAQRIPLGSKLNNVTAGGCCGFGGGLGTTNDRETMVTDLFGKK